MRRHVRFGVIDTDPNTLPSELTKATTMHPFEIGARRAPGVSDLQMLRTNIQIKGNVGTDSIHQIVFGAKGSGTTAQVTAARLYYTGNDATFNPYILLGNITTGPTNNT